MKRIPETSIQLDIFQVLANASTSDSVFFFFLSTLVIGFGSLFFTLWVCDCMWKR